MARADKILRSLTRQRFVATMKSGETFDGILLSIDASVMELVDVEGITKHGRDTIRVPVDGRLYLQRADVAYLQRVNVP